MTLRSAGTPRPSVIALSAVVGLVAAALITGSIGVLPPKLGPSGMRISAAATHVLVDAPPPSIVHRRALPEDVVPLATHAELLGRVMISPPVLERIGRRANVAPHRIAAASRTAADAPLVLKEPGSEERASEILRSRLPYRLEVQARPAAPILAVYTQAPSTAEAKRLADAAVVGLREHLRALANRQGFAEEETVRVRQLGDARGGVINAGVPKAVAVITFLVAFVLSFGSLSWLVRRRRQVAGTLPRRPPEDAGPGDDWPRTTRLLPWMLAGFIAVLWLIPFNDIELTAKLPIDLKFDRLVLPFVAATWVVALAAGGRAAPRLRLTWIHAAVGAFALCAFLSVILNARDLNQALEIDRSLKALPLLISYMSLFLIAASAVRRSEVRAFLVYSLILSTICATGIIWEYRFQYNWFYDWSDKLLPGFFTVGEAASDAIDDGGRRLVRGPARLPLEAVAMLSMALPIALVGLTQAKRWGGRILYGLAACLLMAAMLATYRKSALLAPLSVVLTLAYFRRRELLKLAPLALVLLVVVHILAPGSLGATTSQFDPGRLGVTTVSDRTADYDAVRPDIWTHLAFGRGWGSYDHVVYRILDSELLHRTIEMGVLGLLTFLLMGLSVVIGARATIASRDPTWAPLALAGAAAAVSFLVVSMLFDVLSFPHATYIFLYMAGLVAVVIDWDPHPGRATREKPARRRVEPAHRVAKEGDLCPPLMPRSLVRTSAPPR